MISVFANSTLFSNLLHGVFTMVPPPLVIDLTNRTLPVNNGTFYSAMIEEKVLSNDTVDHYLSAMGKAGIMEITVVMGIAIALFVGGALLYASLRVRPLSVS